MLGALGPFTKRDLGQVFPILTAFEMDLESNYDFAVNGTAAQPVVQVQILPRLLGTLLLVN